MKKLFNLSDFHYDGTKMKKLFKLSDFHYNKRFKSLSVSSELFGGNFPKEVEIASNFTGEIIKFVPDDAMNIDHEYSDGLQLFYKPVVRLKNVKYLCVFHDC